MRRFLDRRPRETDERAAGADDFGERDGLVAEEALGEPVDAVAVAAGPRVEHIGNQHRIVERRDLDAALGEQHPVELHVLSDLEHPRGFEQRLQQRERLGLGELARRQPAAAVEQVVRSLAVADRDVAGLARARRRWQRRQFRPASDRSRSPRR